MKLYSIILEKQTKVTIQVGLFLEKELIFKHRKLRAVKRAMLIFSS